MKTGERLFKFLASLILREFYGTVTIRFQRGKVTHLETETRRVYEHGDLPEAEDAPDARQGRRS